MRYWYIFCLIFKYILVKHCVLPAIVVKFLLLEVLSSQRVSDPVYSPWGVCHVSWPSPLSHVFYRLENTSESPNLCYRDLIWQSCWTLALLTVVNSPFRYVYYVSKLSCFIVYLHLFLPAKPFTFDSGLGYSLSLMFIEIFSSFREYFPWEGDLFSRLSMEPPGLSNLASLRRTHM